MSVEFCDTNVVVYAYDRTAGHKHDRARILIDRLWARDDGALSIQVLQELFVSLTRKIRPPVPFHRAREIVNDLSTWHIVEPTRHDIIAAIDASDRWKVSFWDALILTTARKAGATILWSEDLNEGQSYDGVVVRNPFLSSGP
jgi:predicted nucleic acid-binding protein